MKWLHPQCTVGIVASAMFSGANSQSTGYVGIGPQPPSLSVGEITVTNPIPQEMVFSIDGAGCSTTEVRIPRNQRVKLGCAGTEIVSIAIRTVKPDGAVLVRGQKLATMVHYLIVLDDAGAFILSPGHQPAR